MNYLPSTLTNNSYTGYTVATTYALEQLGTNLSTRNMVDLGCGTGSLGIAALLRGADHAYFIDHCPTTLNSCKQNIQLNNLNQQSTIIKAEIADSQTIAKQLDANKITDVLVNIGPHSIYGGQDGAHLDAIKLLSLFTNCNRVVIGGYGSKKSLHSPQKALELLKSIGFSTIVEEVSINLQTPFPNAPTRQQRSFIVERQ